MSTPRHCPAYRSSQKHSVLLGRHSLASFVRDHAQAQARHSVGLEDAIGSRLLHFTPSLIALAVASGVFGFAFGTEIAAAVRVWMDSTAYNHCFLVPPLIGILLWTRRKVVASAHPSPMPRALLLAPGLALLWAAAALLDQCYAYGNQHRRI